MTRYRAWLVPIAGATLALMAVSVAWACITVQGRAKITNVIATTDAQRSSCPDGDTCAAPGDIIKVKATGATPVTDFWLHFKNYSQPGFFGGGSCSGNPADDDVRISKATTSNTAGKIAKTRGTVPTSATSTSGGAGSALGPALVCFVDKRQSIFTKADTLTVL